MKPGLSPFVYSPFPCSFDEIQSPHLSHLDAASEGWMLDYKRDVPTMESAGKSLSSFANTYGGWVFYGVDAPGGGSPFPQAIPGIAAADTSRVLEILQRAAGTLQPIPFFQARVIAGGSEEGRLRPGRAVVAVRVPPGARPPYVHSNGRIYRRVADSSEPKPETDRHVLDLLWDRSQTTRRRWIDLVETTVTLSKNEEDWPVAHIFLTCDPHGDRGTRLGLEFADFVAFMRDSRSETGGIPFDNFFTAPEAYMARQVAGNDPYGLTLTWRQSLDGTAMISIPIPCGRLDDTGAIFHSRFQGYAHVARFSEACRRSGLKTSRVLDLNIVPFVVHGVLRRYRQILAMGGVRADIHAKVRVDETWRCVPFLDLSEHANFVDSHGVPVLQDASVYAPGGVESRIVLPLERPNCRDDEERALADSMLVLGEVSSALGVPLATRALLSELNELLGRTNEVQRSRDLTHRAR